jgi:hypothetical protein
MGTFNSSLSTAGPVLQNNSGFVNVAFSKHIWSSTASASQNIIMTPLPAGSRITDLFVTVDGDISAGAFLQVRDSNYNGIYVSSLTCSGAHFHRMNCTGTVLNRRMTSSANLYIVVNGGGDAATSPCSLTFNLVTSYLTRDVGD